MNSDGLRIHESTSPLLTYDDLKARFPILDIRTKSHAADTSVEAWFHTDSTDLIDASLQSKVIGRAYFLKYGKVVDTLAVRDYLRKTRKGSVHTSVPLNKLGGIVCDAVTALAPEGTQEKKREVSPYLTLIDLKSRFPQLFPEKGDDAIKHDTTTPVDTWFTSTSKQKVDPSALPPFIGRLFALKHGTTIHPSHIRRYLNGSSGKAVELRQLPSLVSRAVDTLIKGRTERPDRELKRISKDPPDYRGINLGDSFRLGEGETQHRDAIIFERYNPEYIIGDARGRLTPLKGTAPDKAKGTERVLCSRVFASMRGDYNEVDVTDDLLRSCIIAAWDQLGGFGSGYEGNKKSSKSSSGGKPLNIRPR